MPVNRFRSGTLCRCADSANPVWGTRVPAGQQEDKLENEPTALRVEFRQRKTPRQPRGTISSPDQTGNHPEAGLGRKKNRQDGSKGLLALFIPASILSRHLCFSAIDHVGGEVMPKDNVQLICSIAELTPAFDESVSLHDFLQRVVSTVAEHMKATVCSIYLYDESANELVLSATYGLAASAIGNVRMKLGEGITGRAMRELRPIRVDRGEQSPFFKFFPGIREEGQHAFLAVPIIRGLVRVGVLVIQHTEAGYFDSNDVGALTAIASQLAGAIENARLLMTLRTQSSETQARPPVDEEEASVRFVRGDPGAPGVGLGPVKNLEGLFAASLETHLPPGDAGHHSLADFLEAVRRTEQQLETLQQQMEEMQADISAGLVFSAHLLMLKDPAFVGRMQELIETGEAPCEAIVQTVRHYLRVFAESPLPQLQEKVQDIRDLGHRLLSNLLGDRSVQTDSVGHIVIADDVLPSELVKLKIERAEGIVLTGGGVTAHVAILARSLDIPVVVHAGKLPPAILACKQMLIDGSQGHIFPDPDQRVVDSYRSLLERKGEEGAVYPEPVVTRTACGNTINLLANINLLSEVRMARQTGAQGVGLYRSEFPFMIRNSFPSEEEQYRIYLRILEEMEGLPVIFRTLDIGGDKALSYFSAGKEDNPFLGLRAIRFSLRYRDIFSEQLRALLRAGAGRELRIMFPMVSSLEDLDEARNIVQQCLRSLRKEQKEHNPAPLLGLMIEIPAAVELADELAAEADFLSVGSNDLTQYVLAADRTNQSMAEYYCPYHPAVLRCLKRVADAAIRHGKPLSVCGEIANNPKLIPFLLGIGIRSLSMDPRLIASVRTCVEGIHLDACVPLAERALELSRLHDLAAHLGA